LVLFQTLDPELAKHSWRESPSDRPYLVERVENLITVFKPLLAGITENKYAAYDFLIMISTRRFFCRPVGSSEPSGFVFDATGFFAPKPCVAKDQLQSAKHLSMKNFL
jgi:hypothetical protein